MAERGALLALLVVQVVFALFPVAAKSVFPFLDPLPVMAVRVTGAALCLLLLHRLLVRRPVPKGDWKAMAVLAVLGVVVNQVLFLEGLDRTSPVNASLLITTIPVFTYGIAVAMGRESIGPRRGAGILLAMAGSLYLVGLSRFDAGWDTAIGDLMVLVNCVSFSLFLVLSKPYTERYDPLSVTAWVFALAAVLFFPLGLYWGTFALLPSLPGPVLGWMLFIILGPSVLTYLLNAVALRRVPASTVAVFIYIQPILTALFARLILDLQLDLRLLPAALLVFAGVWLVARRRPAALKGAVPAD